MSCGLTKPATDYHRHPTHKGGLNNVCKSCRSELASKRYQQRALEDPVGLMLDRARARAKATGIPFNLVAEDVHIPNYCPVLGLKLERGSGRGGQLPSSPSLDRIHPKRGYVKGNVVVISSRANMLKNDATPSELNALAAFYNRYSQEDRK